MALRIALLLLFLLKFLKLYGTRTTYGRTSAVTVPPVLPSCPIFSKKYGNTDIKKTKKKKRGRNDFELTFAKKKVVSRFKESFVPILVTNACVLLLKLQYRRCP